jgi:hypothetical protein
MRRRRLLFISSWLIVAAPAYFLWQQLNPEPVTEPESRQRQLQAQVDSWQVVLAEEGSTPGPGRVVFVDYSLEVLSGATDTLKAVFMSAGRPAGNEYGSVCRGGPKYFSCEVEELPPLAATHWLTFEHWDGEIRQVKLP